MKNPNGYVIWEGLSLIDGKTPIVVIATGFKTPTSNPKTGNMIQTWIICRDIHPTEAINGGEDKGICGECPHRKIDGKRSCYVNQMSIGAVYKAYKKGNYSRDVLGGLGSFSMLGEPPVSDVFKSRRIMELFRGRRVRIGTYGDPLAIPVRVWWAVTHDIIGHTGYTHQWRKQQANEWTLKRYQKLCMASVDSEEERAEAQALGWRTFRVLTPEESMADVYSPVETRCPNEAEKSITCDSCNLCRGTSVGDNVRSITITVHGIGAAHFKSPSSRRSAQCEEVIG